MKNLAYLEGPASITLGAAGTFTQGVARPVEDALAAALLAKTSVVFSEHATAGPVAPVAAKKSKEA